MRRRLPIACSSLPALILAGVLLLPACGLEGSIVGTWWGPLPEQEGRNPYDGGRGFRVSGLAVSLQEPAVPPAPSRNLLWVVLVGGEEGVSCPAYAGYLDTLAETQRYLDEVRALDQGDPERPENSETIGFVCQSIQGAAREAFGEAGHYRAVHLLMDLSDGGPSDSGRFRPAPLGASSGGPAGAELLIPSTYVGRFYERDVHGEGLLPDSGINSNEGDPNPVLACPALLANLLGNNPELPDLSVPVLNAAAHRYYHRFFTQEELTFGADDGTELVVQSGVVAPLYDQLATIGGELDVALFLDVHDAVGSFPYGEVLLSTRSDSVEVEACPQLVDAAPLAWSELPGLGWSASSAPVGDDDDSGD